MGRPGPAGGPGGPGQGAGRAAERLRREARAAGRLEHPNIARVLDLVEHEGRPYLVTELLEGESLAERVGRGGPMAPVEAARVVTAVADALQAAHRAGIVHRDVKPGNVFLTSGGEVKVLDFGIALAAGEAALTTGDLLARPPTWPPSGSSAAGPPRPPTSTPSGSSSTSCWPAGARSRAAPSASRPCPGTPRPGPGRRPPSPASSGSRPRRPPPVPSHSGGPGRSGGGGSGGSGDSGPG